MTEKEKSQAGLLYNANYDSALIEDRNRCKTLCHQFNHAPYPDNDLKKILITNILGGIKGQFLIEPSFWCDYGYNIEIGDNFYSNHNLVILDAALVRFGDNVFIGPNCGFYTAGHPLDIEQRNEGLEYARPIIVGNNVWFGGNVVVLPGVTIGDHSTIGAGSVVTKDVPPNVVAVGNPCKPIRSIVK